ncbi:MAG: hypothetical protein IIY94_07690 [Oscillospiraceae bacterium]|nr:hypothetical protein [Oscillospiraceae bacterium]
MLKVFPGNMLDATSYGAFIQENHISKGIIVGDKGFPGFSAHDQLEANPDTTCIPDQPFDFPPK